MLVLGARPQFIKSAPVIKELLTHSNKFDLSIVHSGQHYDPEMSAIFFRELDIPRPLVNLHSGSASHAIQTAIIMKRLERPMLKIEPDLVMVPGDTNTTLAGALTAAKLGFPVAHIESGLRSGDLSMPEEINRRLTDHCSALLFAPTKTAMANLRNEGLLTKSNLTGDTMVDALHAILPLLREKRSQVIDRFKLEEHGFILVTLHRPSNVDNVARLRAIQGALCKVAKKISVIFLVHPRTRARLAQARALARRSGNVILAPPQGYVETLALLQSSLCLLTDSGGMQKESFLLRVPCVTLRANTEWPETLSNRANRLITAPEAIPGTVVRSALDERLRKQLKKAKSPFGDGRAAARIRAIVERSLRTVRS